VASKFFNVMCKNTAIDWKFEDTFEGTPPQGWDARWTFVNNTAVVPLATNELGSTPPATTGTHALMQHWATGEDGSLDWLAYYFTTEMEEGEILSFQYWLKYDPLFAPTKPDTSPQFIKSIIGRTTGGSQELYIDSFMGYTGGHMGVLFQQVTPAADWKYANVNGGTYTVPVGDWVHYRWEIKVATETTGPAKNGYLYGWVNGVKRWEYDSIYTIYSGKYKEINLNPTYNDPGLYGDNQRRWWKEFKINRA
jgi:hypothetical protein